MRINKVFIEVNNPRDFIDIGKFCKRYKVPRQMIWVLGEGSIKNQLEKSSMISSHCLANGYNYLDDSSYR